MADIPALENAIDQIVDDGAIMHTLVHGDDTRTVETESGLRPSFAKEVKDALDPLIEEWDTDVSLLGIEKKDVSLSFATFSEMQDVAPTDEPDNRRYICIERANAEYLLQPAIYLPQAGDITFANGRVAELQIDGTALADWFGLVPDGATDNTSAFEVLKERTLGGDYRISVEWSAGDYLFNSPISITPDDSTLGTTVRNVNWRGQGGIASGTATRLIFDIDTAEVCFTLAALVGSSFENMCFRSQQECNTLTLVNSGATPNLSGSNVIFTGCQWQSNYDPVEAFVWVYNTKQVKFDTCWFPVGATDDVTGLRVGDDKINQPGSYQEGAVDNVSVENSIVFSRVDLRNSQEFSIENSTFGDAEYAVITSTGDERMNICRVINTNFVGDTEQTSIYQGSYTNAGAAGENAGGLTVENCKFRDQKIGIHITRGYANISNNQFLLRRSGDTGVLIDAGAKGVEIDAANDFTLGFRNGITTVDDQREGARVGEGIEDVICAAAELETNYTIPVGSLGDALSIDSVNVRSGAARIGYHIQVRQGAAAGRIRLKFVQVVGGTEYACAMSSAIDLDADEDAVLSATRVVFLKQSVGEDSTANGFKVQLQNDAASGSATAIGSTSDSSSIGASWFNVEYV